MKSTCKSLVVITGASSGIGAATAIHFAQLGYPLLLLARRIDKLAVLNLPNTLCCKVDVTDSISFGNAVAEAEARFGPADMLFNNAGIMLLGNPLTQDADEWQQMLNVNIMGVLNGIKTVISGMVRRGHGTIINNSSIAGRKTYLTGSVYCATKFAVHALTEAIRNEVANSNVRLSIIAPGEVRTELTSHISDVTIRTEIEQSAETRQELMLNPKDIARTVEFVYLQPQNVCIHEIVIAHTKSRN